MTEQEEQAVGIPPELEVPFIFQDAYGDGGEIRRAMWVRMPTPEQLLVWQRTVDRLKEAPIGTSWTGSEVMVALERLRKIVDSLLVNKVDVAWIDDRFLEGSLTFQTLAPLITDTVNAFTQAAADSGNRQERRAAKKAAPKKTARKKAG